MSRVHVSATPSGFLPVHVWGVGEDMDRDAYAMAYADLAVAERVAQSWAGTLGAEYVPYEEPRSSVGMAQLVKSLREEHGLGLREAIDRARAMTAEAA